MAEPAEPPWRNGDGAHNPGAGKPPYPSMKELQNMAACLNLGEDPSLNELLHISEDAINKAKTLAQRGKYDSALVNYLRASDITVNMIPRHADFTYMKQNHPRWADQFSRLITLVDSQHKTMEDIKRKIMASNSAAGHSRSTSTAPAAPLRMPSPTSFQRQSLTPRTDHQISRGLVGSRPAGEAAAQDPLAQRFANLRNQRQNIVQASIIASEGSNGSTYSNTLNGNPAAYRPHPQSQVNPNQLHMTPPKPLGPREMNPLSGIAPTIPPKVPMPAVDASLPRYPSPAYSPIWSVPSAPTPNPPRTSVDSIRNTVYKQTHTGATNSNSSINISADNPYRSQTPNGTRTETDSGNRASEIYVGSTITASKLVDYLRKYDVLLIDVRSRDQYDAGHIYAKSIICIEPVALKENISAEELEDRLIISPDTEQSLFSRRNEFDLVVYYDQSTTEPTYLIGSPAGSAVPHLRALYDTLYEFNLYKPLKDGRPPALLAGGLDAWINLVGPQSLATSQTSAILSSVRARKPPPNSAQPLRRNPTVSANSSWEVKKRRLRDYKPLNPEEERAWLEKARNEEIDTSYVTEEGDLTEEPDTIDGSTPEPAASFVHTYEDFLRRFPEPNDIQESMVSAGRAVQFPLYDAAAVAAPSRPPPAIPRPSYSGVTDRGQTQPPLARQSSANKQALYSSPIDRLRLPRTGLINLGSTCYMNSIIQSLSATVQLTKFFVDNRFHSQVQKNWKGSQGVLPGLFANLIRSLWKNDVEVIRPTSFRKFVGRLNTEWAGSQQQDAKEFFDVLVDCLHEDLNLNWQRTPLRPLTFAEEMRREQMPIHKVSNIEWGRYCHRELSYVSSLFAGQHASRLRCTTCRKTSTTYEAFYSISVEIPTTGTGDIYQCLNSYCQEEMLSGDEVWKCPYCKREREAAKQIILTRAPPFLVFHFKRFSASRRQQARKIHTPVSFPLRGLDMTPFMIQQPQPSQSSRPVSPLPNATNGDPKPHASTKPQSSLSPSELATSSPYIYNAYAVVRHLGSTMNEGHYISLVRDEPRKCWRKFDDQRVTDFQPSSSRSSPDNLHNEQAYLVFYERTPAN
ncbi:ubiquitin carboxyl-terminal hydrolase 2 [Arthroderma uncinatum]|uniref:ubiquitin carboxyl-terminal hydrolase 2 n=1 Tax=Arthroderma uncinatum TaxID=74035 RepID=UPI00144A6703|nr:ubiquitin carboxyl-terminal hydrolase 2 [Arthroderma uncinatum]KAF3492320.1 ubiquitin carboxyl-terminal hydrolase 2 [Arthroderma uncinatum]